MSTRVTAHAIAAAEASGRALALAGVGVDEARLRSETDWIGWAAYQRLLVVLAGGDDAETLRRHGRLEIEQAARTPYASLPSLFGGTSGLFHATYRWVLPSTIRVVDSAIVPLGGGLRLQLRLAPHCADGCAFFGSVVGTLEHLPTLAGEPRALVRATIGSHEASYDVELMPSSSVGGRIRRAWGALWDADAAEAVRRTHESITGAIERFEQANATLTAAEARWRELVARHLGAVLVVDRSGAILERLADGVGLADGGWLGKGLRTEHRELLASQLARVLETRARASVEIATPDDRWFACHLDPVAEPAPRVLVVAHEITERRRAEAVTRANEARLTEARKLEAIGRVAARLAAAHGAADATGWLQADLAHGSAVDARAVVRGALWPGLGADVALVAELDGPPAPVAIDPEALRRLVRELLMNAREAMPAGGNVRVRIDEVVVDEPRPDLAPARYVRLAVGDDGVGMSEAVRSRALEPFFSGWGGRGLGLASVYFTAMRAGGSVDLTSRPGRGTCVQVWLRRAEGPRAAARVPTSVRGDETVVLAHGEAQVRDALVQLLTVYGYRVHAGRDGEQALALTARLGQGYDVVVADLDSSGGADLVRRLRDGRPALPLVLLSGDPSADADLPRDPAVAFLQKPFGGRALATAIRRLLEGPEP